MSVEPLSLGALFLDSCERWRDRLALIMPLEGGGYERITYGELRHKVFEFSKRVAATGVSRGDMLCILSENRTEWILADWACQCLGITVVPIYPTLPADQAQFIVQNCGARVVLASNDKQCEKLALLSNVTAYSFDHSSTNPIDDVVPKQLDEEVWKKEIEQIQGNEIATIIYTSGTTGNPKGAVLPHRTFLSLTKGIRDSLPVDELDLFLSFLPLSHVYQRFAGHVLPVACGAANAFSRGAATLGAEMMELQPTIMLTVPRLLESVRLRIVDAVKKQSGLRQWLFHCALSQGLKRVRGEFAPFASILDALVGKKIRARTGGRIKFFVSGGAALSPAVAEFFLAFRMNVLQGYGLTETMAATCVNHPDRNRPETVGEPIRGVELKIAQDGEILVRGPSVMDGYFNLPEATAEAIDGEGWFHTGDIGEFADGRLKITDRKKDLIVLANGKNVAPQPIENRLKESGWIGEAVLFGDDMDSICGLIVPNFDRLKVWAHDHGMHLKSETEIATAEPVRDFLRDQILEVNKTLADYERVKRHEILDVPFTIEGGELTPSLKVKRKVVREKYQQIIDRMNK